MDGQHLDRKLLDGQHLDRKLLDGQHLDRQHLDRKLLDRKLLDRKLLERQFVERRVLVRRQLDLTRGTFGRAPAREREGHQRVPLPFGDRFRALTVLVRAGRSGKI